jgi:hypothetical protein
MLSTADTLRLKIQRAENHFFDFEAALGLCGSPIDRTATGRVHVNNDRRLEFTTNLAIPGPEHGIIIGDLVHQLRACLDNLAYAMVKPICTDVDTLRKVQFPIFDHPDKLRDNWRFHALIKVFGASSSEIAEFKATQPYERNPARPTADYLWIVSELDNIDKHRTILVVNPTVSVRGTLKAQDGKTRSFTACDQPIKSGAAVLDIGWPIPDPPPEVDVERAAQLITLSETGGLCDGKSIYWLVRRMVKAVSDVVTAFEAKKLI